MKVKMQLVNKREKMKALSKTPADVQQLTIKKIAQNGNYKSMESYLSSKKYSFRTLKSLLFSMLNLKAKQFFKIADLVVEQMEKDYPKTDEDIPLIPIIFEPNKYYSVYNLIKAGEYELSEYAIDCTVYNFEKSTRFMKMAIKYKQYKIVKSLIRQIAYCNLFETREV